MTFKKGQVINRGEHLTAEKRTKIIAMRKSGKKWREVAEEQNVPTKRAMTWAKRAWYKNAFKSEAPVVEVKEEVKKEVKDGKVDNLSDEKKKEIIEACNPKDKGVVEKVKAKDAKNVDTAIEKHIKKSDKEPKTVSKGSNANNDKEVGDKGAKKGLNERKSINIWFLVAIVLAVVTIGVIFLVIKPKDEEKAKYNEPTKEKSTGFEGRSVEDL